MKIQEKIITTLIILKIKALEPLDLVSLLKSKILMSFIKKMGIANFLMLGLCVFIIVVAEYLFLSGDKLHGIFIGLWAPTLLGVMIYLKLISNEHR